MKRKLILLWTTFQFWRLRRQMGKPVSMNKAIQFVTNVIKENN